MGWHYLKLVAALCAAGLPPGLVGGTYFGHLMTDMYTIYFRFPVLAYRMDPGVYGIAAAVSLMVGTAGGLNAVRHSIRLSPAVAMAPPMPAQFRAGALVGAARALSLFQPTRMIVILPFSGDGGMMVQPKMAAVRQNTELPLATSHLRPPTTEALRMIFRHLFRWPLRTGLTIAGKAFAVALILEVGDQSRLEIVVDLLSTDAVKVNEGDPVWVVEWGGPKALSGVVRRVEPFGFTKVSALGIEEQRVNVIVDLGAPLATIVTDQRANVIKIPVSALFRVGETWSVFINRDFVARLQRVELGQRNGLEAESYPACQQASW